MTATALARKFAVAVDTTGGGVWTAVAGIYTLAFPPVTPNMSDSTSYDQAGGTTSEPTAYSWSATFSAYRRLTGGATYDPAQEFLRLLAFQNFGDTSRANVRIYDKQGGPEAFQGFAYVQWAKANNGVNDLDAGTVTLTGDGLLTIITNPVTGSLVPQAVSALPTAQSVGKILSIRGNLFTGTTAITIGGVSVAAGAFTVQSDNFITAVVPAGTAGSAPVVVTNAAGAGNSLAYTRGA